MSSLSCTSNVTADCAPETCRWRCAVDVIDDLLSRPGTVTGPDADDLLDLRWKLLQPGDAENTLRFFCDARRRMERRHYLAFFRIRRWLESHLYATVIPSSGTSPRFVPINLDYYCVEAVRRACLCAASRAASILERPSLRFAFRPTRTGTRGLALAER